MDPVDIVVTIITLLVVLAIFTPIFGFIVLANFGNKNRLARIVTYVFLVLGSLLMCLVSFGFLLSFELAGDADGVHTNIALKESYFTGLIILSFALISLTPVVPHVRRFFARFIPIDPSSCIHTTGLVFAFWLLILMFIFAFSIDMMELTEATAEESIFSFLALMVEQELIFLIIGILAVGFLVRRDLSGIIKRLCLEKPTKKQVISALLIAFAFVAFDYVSTYVVEIINPEAAKTADEMEKSMMRPLIDSWILIGLAGAIIIGLSAGVCEEVLFRGAIQPAFGIWFTTLLFVAVHVQYVSFWWWAFPILALASIVLGWMRKNWNTTSAIITHAIYDIIVIGLLVLGV